MTRARAVVGANFGDEGKGLVVDYLCAREGAGVVVRYSGGANAGHTVCADGKRHVFSHVGSGALAGVPTYLSEFFVVNPVLLIKELDELANLGVRPKLYAHPNCLVTTFADMTINQRLETARGDKRHGSCGVGVHETKQRSKVIQLKITLADLWNGNYDRLRAQLNHICSRYAEFRTGSPISGPAEMIEAFVRGCAFVASQVEPAGMAAFRNSDPVFEGSQGLLLDEDNAEYFPHVTHAKTGLANVRVLCLHASIGDLTAYYVSRTYLTRHGAGPLPGEDPKLRYADDTNVEHSFQGGLRFASLDVNALLRRTHDDVGTDDYNLVLTHCDQRAPSVSASLTSFGPDRSDVSRSYLARRVGAGF